MLKIYIYRHKCWCHRCTRTDGRTEREDRICNCKIINLKPHYLGRIEPRRIEAWWLKQWAAEGQKPWTTSTFSLGENHGGTFSNRRSFTVNWFQFEVWRMHISPTSWIVLQLASHITLYMYKSSEILGRGQVWQVCIREQGLWETQILFYISVLWVNIMWASESSRAGTISPCI